MAQHLKRIAEAGKALRAARGYLIPMAIFFAAAAIMAFEPLYGSASLATLYIFANNGKVSGRMDGDVKMRNGVGRGFTVPALIQNGYTTAQRAVLSAVSSSWNGLTQAQMETWNNAIGFFKSNRFGQVFALKGKALYTSLNCNLVDVAQAPIQAAPLSTEVPGMTVLTGAAAAGAGTFTIAFSPTPTDAGVDTIIFATTQLSAGRFRPGASQFRIITVVVGATASPANIAAAYVSKFGALVAGTKIFIKAKPINSISGQAGGEIVASVIVAP